MKVTYVPLFSGSFHCHPQWEMPWNLFPFHSLLLAASCWPFSMLFSPLNTATGFAFDLEFTCKYVFTLCANPQTCALLSPPWSGEMLGENSQPQISSPAPIPTVFSCHIQSAPKRLINYRCIHGALAWVRKRKMIPPHRVLSGREGEREAGLHNREKCHENLAVSRFLLAVILVSGFETSVQSQLWQLGLLFVDAGGIISPTKFPQTLSLG